MKAGLAKAGSSNPMTCSIVEKNELEFRPKPMKFRKRPVRRSKAWFTKAM